MCWDVQGVQQAPTTTAWTHVWDESYRNQIIPVLGTVAEGRLYQGGQGLLELDVTTGKELLNVNWTKEHPVYLESAPLLYQGKLYGIVSEQKATEMTGVSLLYQRLSCLDATTGKILWQSDEIGTWEKPCGRPLLLGGKVYVAACFPVPESGKALETDVHAAVGIWDVATGKLTGRIPLPNGAYPDALLVSDGTSVYGNAISNPSWGHVCSSLFRYDPATAKVVWSIAHPTNPKDFHNIHAALAVDGETLVTVFDTEDNSDANGGLGVRQRTAAAFDTTTGHVLWTKTEIDSTYYPSQYPCVAVREGIAFFTVHDGTVVAVDGHTGVQKWSFNAKGFVVHDNDINPDYSSAPRLWYPNLYPRATRDVLYVQEGDNDLVALDPATGTKLWQKTLLTTEEQVTESKQLCCIMPVDKGLIIVTADSSDLRPIIELWK
ncbi:MAG: PQQ-binding-like beta-propeller repeat protein [Candidatus Cryosericum sp.]